jgi:hypothetical protein
MLDGEDGGNDYHRGVGWYRRWFTPAATAASGANPMADVRASGTHLGQRLGAFASFHFEVSLPAASRGACDAGSGPRPVPEVVGSRIEAMLEEAPQ